MKEDSILACVESIIPWITISDLSNLGRTNKTCRFKLNIKFNFCIFVFSHISSFINLFKFILQLNIYLFFADLKSVLIKRFWFNAACHAGIIYFHFI